MARKRAGKSKKRNPKVVTEEAEEIVRAPHSFVIHRGYPCPYLQEITKDFRRIMEPFTASRLHERKSNKIKDFVSLSGVFHVSHLCIFNKTTTQLSFKIVRLPRGPTLTFKVHQYTLSRDIISSSKHQYVDDDSFTSAPLVVMNNFTGEGKHLKLMASTFQNMFPTINLATVNLKTLKRCLLFSYNPITKLTEMRHYTILVTPVGLTKAVKKVVMQKIPNMSNCADVSDFVMQSGAASDSEFEDDGTNHVILAQNLRRKGNLEDNKSAIRLYEIGPRLTFELIKIEEGLLTGEVLYHERIVKSEEEIERIRKTREKKRKLKEYRRKEQDKNREKKLSKSNEIKKDKNKAKGPNAATAEADFEEVPQDMPDNDAEYYKEEVGADPDEELFTIAENNSRKRVRLPKHIHVKRQKKDNSEMRTKTKSNNKNHDDNKNNKSGNKVIQKKKKEKKFPLHKRGKKK